MWPRVVEVMLGVWLVMSPFVFQHDPDQTMLWVNDLTCGLLVWIFAVFSCWKPARNAHFGVTAIALWLIALGWGGADRPPPAAYQNDMVTGILLLMFSIIPTESLWPPVRWQRWYEEEAERQRAAEDAEVREGEEETSAEAA